MSVSRIASRYAKSLLELAVEKNKLETILEDIHSLQSAFSNRDLFLLIKSPVVNPDKKQEIMNLLFKGKVDEITFSFISLAISKGREIYLPEIAEAFSSLYKEYKNISTVVLTTARELNKEEIARIQSQLLENGLTSKEIDLITKVDPSIIGGFVIKIADKLYDASVAHKLEELKKTLTADDYVVANS